MGARALNEVGKGFYWVLGEAHKVTRPKIKAPIKQEPIILEKYLDWVEALQPQLWLGEPSSTFVEYCYLHWFGQ